MEFPIWQYHLKWGNYTENMEQIVPFIIYVLIELEVISISKNVLKIWVDLFSFGLAIWTIRSSKNTNHTQIF